MVGTTRKHRSGLAVAALSLLLLTGPAALAATISGTPGNDHLRGTPGADTIHGYAGDDDIRPGRGRDVAYGGRGNDDISLESDGAVDRSGADRGFGGPGHDNMGVGRRDVARMGAGNDFGWAWARGGVIYGGPGRDVMWAYAPARLHFGPGRDLACGGDSSDQYPRATFRYWLGRGDDRAFGDAWNGLLCYEEPDLGTDIVWAGRGDDQLFFVIGGRDEVYAGPGNDTVRVRNPDHRVVVCGPGRDVLTLVGRARPPEIRGCERILRR